MKKKRNAQIYFKKKLHPKWLFCNYCLIAHWTKLTHYHSQFFSFFVSLQSPLIFRIPRNLHFFPIFYIEPKNESSFRVCMTIRSKSFAVNHSLVTHKDCTSTHTGTDRVSIFFPNYCSAVPHFLSYEFIGKIQENKYPLIKINFF